MFSAARHAKGVLAHARFPLEHRLQPACAVVGAQVQFAMAGEKANKNARSRILRLRAARKAARKPVARAQMQGVGSAPRRAFGSTPGRSLRVFDATSPAHLALPRATGPYTVVRTSAIVNTTAQLGFACSFADMNAAAIGGLEAPTWSKTCWVEEAIIGPINAANAAYRQVFPGIDALGPACSLVPAALTVQVMCPTALTGASGIVYIGRSHAQYDLAGSTRTWDQIGQNFVSFMAPRLCSAGKLALRGVKVSSYPLDMSDLADFRPYDGVSAGAFTFDANQRMNASGLAPIVIYNPNNVSLQLVITMEWRVRFDMENPAASTHTTHTPASDSLWSKLSAASAAMGHGVVDIAEDTAVIGAEAAASLGVAALLA